MTNVQSTIDLYQGATMQAFIEKAVIVSKAVTALLHPVEQSAPGQQWVVVDLGQAEMAYQQLDEVCQAARGLLMQEPMPEPSQHEFLTRLESSGEYTLATLNSAVTRPDDPTVHRSRSISACRQLREVLNLAQSLRD